MISYSNGILTAVNYIMKNVYSFMTKLNKVL